jgi:hypothetical protein
MAVMAVMTIAEPSREARRGFELVMIAQRHGLKVSPRRHYRKEPTSDDLTDGPTGPVKQCSVLM